MKGNLGIIACTMLEDELVFALKNDSDEKNIFIVETGYTKTLVDKLRNNDIKFEMMPQCALDADLNLCDGFNIVIIMNSKELHSERDKLRKTIEKQAVFYCEMFDVVTLYYGTCGNFGWDMTEYMSHKSKTPFIVFRDDKGKVCDDCVGVAVGGTEEYYNLMKKYTGQFYLTPCGATNWGKYSPEDVVSVDDFDSGDEYMKFLLQIGGCKYALKIDTGIGDRERYDIACREIAKSLDLQLCEPDTKIATSKLAKKIWRETKEALKKCERIKSRETS